jgi:hypothetical protein
VFDRSQRTRIEVLPEAKKKKTRTRSRS